MYKTRIIPGVILLMIAIKGFSQKSDFGLGIIIGEPTGISAKVWTGKTTAIDAAAAWSFYYPEALHLHADFLKHNFALINVNSGKLPFYYGLGAQLKIANEPQLGIRIPVGLSYIFENFPIDTFIEIVPELDIVPATQFWINAAIGVRYYFD